MQRGATKIDMPVAEYITMLNWEDTFQDVQPTLWWASNDHISSAPPVRVEVEGVSLCNYIAV